MNWETLKNLYIDIFHEPKVGWYDRALNQRALEAARDMGISFMQHLVEKDNPYKVIDMYNPPRPGQYEKVNIPPRSELTFSGRRYYVSPKNIIPYSPDNKSLANVLLRKGLGIGSKVLNRLYLPFMFMDGMGWNSRAE